MDLQPEKPKHTTPRLPPLEKAGESARRGTSLLRLPERPVVVGGGEGFAWGQSVQNVRLPRLVGREAESGGLREALFRTISHNVYRIRRSDAGAWMITNYRSRVELPLPDLAECSDSLEVGARFVFGPFRTAPLAQIVTVGGSRIDAPQTVELAGLLRAAIQQGGGLFCVPPLKARGGEEHLPEPAKEGRVSLSSQPTLVVTSRGGALGWEVARFPVAKVVPAADGSVSPFREIFFRTKSGNLYGIMPSDSGALALISAREALAWKISVREVASLRVRVGKQFPFDDNRMTSPVAQIVAVTAEKRGIEPPFTFEKLSLLACRQAGGNVNCMRAQFVRLLNTQLGEGALRSILAH